MSNKGEIKSITIDEKTFDVSGKKRLLKIIKTRLPLTIDDSGLELAMNSIIDNLGLKTTINHSNITKLNINIEINVTKSNFNIDIFVTRMIK